MALPDNTDPNVVADRTLQQRIDQRIQRGELSQVSWSGHVRPATGWSLDSFQGLLRTNTPATPAFEGAATHMAWMKLAKDDIGAAEGNEAYAYHGSQSPERRAGKFRVAEGDNVNGHEVSVGYGFNLTQPGGRQLYDAALQGQDAPSYDDVLNGRKPVSPAQALALQEYMILQKNAVLDRQLGGAPLRDHQRAALVSMLYQGINTSAVVDAIKRGEPETAVAQLIRNSGPATFKTRRDHEASRYLGAAAAQFFDNSTNQLPGRAQ